MGSPDPVGDHVLVMFDGVCNLCNGFVQFLIRRDASGKFRFASLQSAFAQQRLTQFGLDPAQLHSVIVIENGKIYERSDAALRVAVHLPGLWPAMRVFYIIPRGLRDVVYNWVAASRYRWFGRRETCMVPDPSLKSRFVG
jgi:predicted DCC family thiol-disulfide oxidoreductase YuxK